MDSNNKFIGFGTLSMVDAGTFCYNRTKFYSILDTIVRECPNAPIDGGRAYYDCEKAIGEYPDRSKLKIIAKVGIDFGQKNPHINDPLIIKQQLQESLDNMKVDSVHIMMLHRIDFRLPMDTISALYGELIQFKEEGKATYIGVSETNAEILAHLAPHIDFVEISYSPFTRRADNNGVMSICQKHDIKLIAYTSALRGFLNKDILQFYDNNGVLLPPYTDLLVTELKKKLFDTLHINEMEQTVGFYRDEFVKNNMQIVAKFILLALSLNMTPVALSLSYNASYGIISIPGTSKAERVIENIKTCRLLSSSVIHQINDITSQFKGNPNPQMAGFYDEELD